MLEVIALSVADARAARAGGADRIELVGTMRSDGLSPTLDMVKQIQDEVDMPIRVMVRTEAGFGCRNPQELRRLALAYADLGVDGLVLGFLKAGEVDVSLTNAVLADIDIPFTFHRAIDHATNYRESWAKITGLDGTLSSVLTAGSPRGVDKGMNRLKILAATRADLMLVGGGLRMSHVPRLRQFGIRHFHVGNGVRPRRDFNQDIDPRLVEQWVDVIS